MDDLLLLLPEIVLLVFAFIIFGLDLFWKGKANANRAAFPALALVGSVGALAAAFFIWMQAGRGAIQLSVIATDSGNRIPMLAADQFSLFFKVYASVTIALVGLVAADYIKAHTRFQGEFYALTLLAGLALMLVSSSTNLVMIFLSFEFLSITSYLLTGYLRDDALSVEGALKYFLYGAVASGVMLYGFSLVYGATGSVDLHGIALGLAEADGSIPDVLVIPAIALIVVGLGFKIALVPFHQWSPEAYQGAPTPITAFLSVGPKAAGFALMVRVLTIAFPAFAHAAAVNWVVILSGIAMLTMTFGNVVAIWQKDIKRLFAYSSIAQAGYMLIGVVAIAPQYVGAWPAFDGLSQGLNGLLIYLLAYLFTNLGSFAVIIAVENKTGSSDIARYAGLIKRSPYMAIAFFVFLLSLVGIPPTAGFMGKLFVFGAAIKQQMYPLAIVAIINSVISVYYYFYIVRQMFFGEPEDTSPIAASRPLYAAITIALVLVFAIAIGADPFIKWAGSSAHILAAAF
ncbi:MAG: NADH-quinone oxidoreductase subunit N [Anaerolineae bacterium]